MDSDVIFLQLKKTLIAEFEIDADSIRPEQRLYEDLELDSLDAVDLLVSLKDHIEGKINPALFKEARTVGDVVDILRPIWNGGAA
jgi:acyl carrier protein